MMNLLGAAIWGLVRASILVVLAILVAVNAAGLLLLAYGHLIGAEVHANGGPATVLLGLAFLMLCLSGMRALIHPRSN
jgi:hypothetical protein